MSKLTDFLKLHIWEIPTDNKQQFNYPKAIAENFKKLDANAKEVNENKLQTDKEISTLKEEDNKLQQENEQLKSQIPTGKSSGEEITLNDSSNLPFKELKVIGNSFQETSEQGKNLFSGFVKGVAINNGDGAEGSNSTSATTGFIEVDFEKNPNYYISGLLNTLFCFVASYDKDKNFMGRTGGVTRAEFAITNDSFIGGNIPEQINERKYIRITTYETSSTSGKINDVDNAKVLLEVGTNATEYEPFTPDKPSPDYLSETRNCGDNINLLEPKFQEDSKNNVTMKITNKGWLLNGKANTHNTFTIFEKELPAGNYIINGMQGASNSTFQTVIEEVSETSKVLSYLTTSYRTFSLTKNTTIRLTFHFYQNQIFDNLIIPYKLEQGTQTTPYSPYNCGNVNFKSQNKNWFNFKDWLNYIKNSSNPIHNGTLDNVGDNSFTITSTGDDCYTNSYETSDEKVKIYVKENTSYTIFFKKANNISGYSYIFFYDKNNKIISNEFFSTNIKNFKTPVDTYYIGFRFGMLNTDKTETYSDLMLLEGTFSINDILDYIPYQSQSISFPTKEGQVFHKGDYLADDGVHHVMTEYVVTGNEPIDSYDIESSGCFAVKVNFRQKYNNDELKFLCDRLKARGIWSIRNNKEIGIAVGVLDTYLYVNLTGAASNLEEAKESWKKLAGMKILYVPLEEQIEPYSPEQQEAYDKIKELTGYKNVTHIFSEDEIKPSFEVTYYKDLETLLGVKSGG